MKETTGIKCVLFDFGDVFCRPQDQSCIEEMITISGIPAESFFEAYFKDRSPYDQNLVDGREYWRRLLEKLGKAYDDQKLDRLVELDVKSWSDVDPRMVKFARDLKTSGMRIGVLSNMPPEHAAAYRRDHQWLEEFDYLFLSAEFKLIKPSSEIYEYVLSRIEEKPSETLFIDDKDENISAAEAAGILGFHYTAEKTVEDLYAHFGLGY